MTPLTYGMFVVWNYDHSVDSTCPVCLRILLSASCILAVSVDGFLWSKPQTVCVKGQLRCRTNPASAGNVRIKLYDEDTGPNPDDLMADGLTDEFGNFDLCGSASDPIGNIDPIFKVYHNCDDEGSICKRKSKFEIADQYIGGTFEFEDGIDLTIRYPSEDRKCIQLP